MTARFDGPIPTPAATNPWATSALEVAERRRGRRSERSRGEPEFSYGSDLLREGFLGEWVVGFGDQCRAVSTGLLLEIVGRGCRVRLRRCERVRRLILEARRAPRLRWCVFWDRRCRGRSRRT